MHGVTITMKAMDANDFAAYMQRALSGVEKVVVFLSDNLAAPIAKRADITLGGAAVALSNGIQANMSNHEVKMGPVGLWAMIDGLTENSFDFCGRFGYDKSLREYHIGYSSTNAPLNIVACISPYAGVASGAMSLYAALRDAVLGSGDSGVTLANVSNLSFSAVRASRQTIVLPLRSRWIIGGLDVAASAFCADWRVWLSTLNPSMLDPRPSVGTLIIKGPPPYGFSR